MRVHEFAIISIIVLALVLIVGPQHSLNTSAKSGPAAETYTGTIIGVGGQLGGVSRPFTLSIDGFTSTAEARRDVAILAERGQDGLLNALQGKRLGYFSLGSQLGRDLNFVYQTQNSDGSRHITILFERWMNLYELRSGTRSTDYPFSYVELTVDRSGKGEGSFIPAAKIRFNKKHEVEVENFGIYPARLAGVERRNK